MKTGWKILIAMDSFKGCMTSAEAGEAVAAGIRESGVGAEVCVVSVSDGGEGLTEAIAVSAGGDRIFVKVSGPDGRKVKTSYLWQPDVSTAWIEMAAAAGLVLLPASGKMPLEATTFGVGEIIADALVRGAKRIVIGLGGSATTDAGLGALQALGYRFYDRCGKMITKHIGGGLLSEIESIDDSGRNPLLPQSSIEIACDVDAPLYGPRGAAYVFAPQKGADETQVRMLDMGLRHVAPLLEALSPDGSCEAPGSGAAGGCGAAFSLALGGRMRSGADLMTEALSRAHGFDTTGDFFASFDMVITGEGSSDRQTLMGKIPAAIMREAKKAACSCILMSGRVCDTDLLLQAGFSAALSINDPDLCGPTDDAEDPLMTAVARRRLQTASATVIPSLFNRLQQNNKS